jgi:hypothetical protein
MVMAFPEGVLDALVAEIEKRRREQRFEGNGQPAEG